MVASISRKDFNGNGLEQIAPFVHFTNVIKSKLAEPENYIFVC